MVCIASEYCAFSAAFTPADFEQFVQAVVPLTIWIGIISLGVEICRSFLRFEVEIHLKLLSYCHRCIFMYVTDESGCMLDSNIIPKMNFRSILTKQTKRISAEYQTEHNDRNRITKQMYHL